MRWGHVSYEMTWVGDISHRWICMKFISTHVCAIWDTEAFSLKNHCGFNKKVLLFWCLSISLVSPHLVEICRNVGICCSFRAVTASEKYPVFILLQWYKEMHPTVIDRFTSTIFVESWGHAFPTVIIVWSLCQWSNPEEHDHRKAILTV